MGEIYKARLRLIASAVSSGPANRGLKICDVQT